MRTIVAVLAAVTVASNPYQPVAYTPYVAVAMYGAGYAAEPQNPPPQPAQQQGDVIRRLDNLEKKIDQLLALLNKLFEEDDKSPAAGQRGDPFLLGAGKCLNCHGPDTAKAKGEGFVLFEKKADGMHFRSLSERDAKAVRKELTRKTMPPADNKDKIPPLTDAERSALLEAIK